MKQKARLENWYDTNRFGFDCLIGDVYGHPSFTDGTEVRTSRILKKEGNTVETANAIYELGKQGKDELAKI